MRSKATSQVAQRKPAVRASITSAFCKVRRWFGKLPSVSWIIPPLGFDEHPSSSPNRGNWFTQQVLNALSANKKVWSKTVLFLMYDENDGWFDHVSPPVAPKGTKDEWLTAP